MSVETYGKKNVFERLWLKVEELKPKKGYVKLEEKIPAIEVYY